MADCDSCASDALDAGETSLRRVLWIALIANFGMFAVELVGSWWGDSMALQADALDFFGDGANYAISLFVLGMALRMRSYAALFKSLSMALFGLWVIASAVHRAITGSAPDPYTMGSIAILALAVNLGVAGLLYRYRSGDANLRSIWLCSRNDAIGNIAVMVAATGVLTLGTRWPDLLVATLIASLNLWAAAQVVRQVGQELRSVPVRAISPDIAKSTHPEHLRLNQG
ncbi:MAG: cation transporter [Pseudomonadales bacterium]|jgi:cation diffusion facilitator family transporter|nr:cation transporter [Pseudomonadales bacterium]MDP6470970.1 cation transporter [Pseudomonadales bacterium]MDP6825845.1 cation transporter [Pseudomonadales bacterium]MDP6972812.1 cation transporter [Pseudomonadales bacterium]|tara:strand:+ start:5966 stop:6649 length:684 start_codon:yes stop_codon:yes gene_type:complete